MSLKLKKKGQLHNHFLRKSVYRNRYKQFDPSPEELQMNTSDTNTPAKNMSPEEALGSLDIDQLIQSANEFRKNHWI